MRMETIDAAGTGVEMENRTVVEIEATRHIPLANSIEQILTSLRPTSTESCIIRVPRRLRQVNEKAYTPQMVSIGPLHYGNTDLKDMEEQKMRYLKSFLGRTTMNLEDCVQRIKEWEERVRNCYADTIRLGSDEFVKMVLVDSSFIIESMVSYALGELTLNFLFIRTDLILLENQLPFFLLEGLFNLAFVSNYPINISVRSSFLNLSLRYFKDLMLIQDIPENISSPNVKHFVDLLRICHLPSSEGTLSIERSEFVPIQNATALHGSGVKFQSGSKKCLLDIQYAKGVLGIPRFRIADYAEPVLRNLIALELYLYWLNSYIIDYIFFMDGLIDTPKDVDILVQNGVLDNWLGDNSAVANLFNNLTTEVGLCSNNYYFSSLSSNLNSYCEVPWHSWKATLKRDYFSSPWRVASTVAAAILLGLTFIQTLVSLIHH